MRHLDEFTAYLLAEKRYSVHTARAYADDVGQFGGFLGASEPELVSGDDLRSWIMHLSGDEHSAATSINRKISSVKAFFRYLRKREIIHSDPFVRITAMKTPRRLPSFVEESKMDGIVRSMLASYDDLGTERDSLMILLLYATGIRLAELTGIHIMDFSDGFNTLKVRGKGDKERIIPLAPQIKAKILHYIGLIKELNICIDDNFSLFLTEEGKPVSRSHVYGTVRGVLKGAGVQGKSSPHVLRHTFATHLLNGEADIRSIQELLGHSSLAATQVYTHNTIEQLKKAYTKAHPRANRTITKK